MTKKQKLKKAVQYVFDQLDYGFYLNDQAEKWKRGLSVEENRKLRETFFNDWLVEKKIVEVMGFEEWRRAKRK